MYSLYKDFSKSLVVHGDPELTVFNKVIVISYLAK